MPKLLQQKWEEGFQRLKEVNILECMYYLRLENVPVEYVPWEVLEKNSFTK